MWMFDSALAEPHTDNVYRFQVLAQNREKLFLERNGKFNKSN